MKFMNNEIMNQWITIIHEIHEQFMLKARIYSWNSWITNIKVKEEPIIHKIHEQLQSYYMWVIQIMGSWNPWRTSSTTEKVSRDLVFKGFKGYMDSTCDQWFLVNKQLKQQSRNPGSQGKQFQNQSKQ